MTIIEVNPNLVDESVSIDIGNVSPILKGQEDAASPNIAQENETRELNIEREREYSENDDINASSNAGGTVGRADERKMKHWKDSKFAVGCVNVTWEDDRPSWWFNSGSSSDGCGDNDHAARTIDHQYAFSSIVCGCLGAGRVGNMVVLAQSIEKFEEEIVDPDTSQVTIRQKKRPKLLWVVGPYWTVNLFITFPLIFGVSGWICYQRITKSSPAIIITWTIGTFFMVFSLCMISCRNPGILYRHSQIPTTAEEEWRWNDQARTYRPASSRFDTECQVVVEGFDHTCPWTGTAIGSKNMFWFKMFVCMVPIMLFYTLILAALGGQLLPLIPQT